MAKLHQVLAVEGDLEGKYKRICTETIKVFGKGAMFTGFHRTLKLDKEGAIGQPDENQAMATTVPDRLEYTTEAVVEYFKCLLQKEATNQKAVADLIVDGTVIGNALPATFLLALESRLRFVRTVYEAIPTLDAGTEWKKAPERGENIWQAVHPEENLKTELQFKSQILVEPTQFHPAQIEKWQEQVAIGRFVKTVWSGMITSARKSELLGRIDKLISAVKVARQEANSVKVEQTEDVAGALMAYING